jgi:hypothetical protein
MRSKYNRFFFNVSCILYLITSRNFPKDFVVDNLAYLFYTGNRTFLLHQFNLSFDRQCRISTREICSSKIILLGVFQHFPPNGLHDVLI